MKSFRIPFIPGRFLYAPYDGKGSATILADQIFATNLRATHLDGDGKVRHEHDLGSGLVTNAGVTALANDFNWAANCQTLKLANFHASGTGTTAAAATDIQLQTLLSTPTPATGVQTLVSAANTQKYQTVGTLAYTTTSAVTEWGLFSSSTLSGATGSPFTATSATSATVTGTPYTASSSTVQGETQNIVYVSGSSVYGLILSNTSSVLTIPAWYSSTTGSSGSTPSSTANFTILPVMWDHKVFSAINVVPGDSIIFSYSLQINSGG